MDDCLATFVPRAFEGIPRTRMRRYGSLAIFYDVAKTSKHSSDVPAMSHFSPRRIDFTLVPGHGNNETENIFPENNTQCLLLGMKESTQTPSFDSPSILTTSIPEELTSHGQLHLTRLASLIKREATTESFPEWFILFGLIYDAHRVRVVAYLPLRRKSDVIECVVYVVDELWLHSVTGPPTCELAIERLRFLLALTTLRRHVHHLSKSLFTVTIGPRDGIRQTDNHPSLFGCSAHNSNDSESLHRCASLGSSQHCSSEYSTCPSSVHAREWNDVLILECGEELSSSCRSFTSSYCSTCLSLLESASTSDSICSEDSNYMEPSTISLSQGGNKSVPRPNKLTETKRREIIAWAREVIPTEHPVKDTYRMVIYHLHPRRQKVANFKSSTGR
ncbi:hypothetical protein J3R83DRAFT_2130 [Lanmaoa asiatica]|nr:hypothetical protein J3R83DRAFT_2130 [Lanmaoa asiatica]